MQKKDNVSMSVIRRLPRYYRFLSELCRRGETRVSSKELSEKMGFTASQIRQDFNCFGGFGQQGYGYNVPQLCAEIERILGIQQLHKCVLIGAGNLGKAIVGHMPFVQLGFELIGVFDKPFLMNCMRWGSRLSGISVTMTSPSNIQMPS